MNKLSQILLLHACFRTQYIQLHYSYFKKESRYFFLGNIGVMQNFNGTLENFSGLKCMDEILSCLKDLAFCGSNYFSLKESGWGDGGSGSCLAGVQLQQALKVAQIRLGLGGQHQDGLSVARGRRSTGRAHLLGLMSQASRFRTVPRCEAPIGFLDSSVPRLQVPSVPSTHLLIKRGQQALFQKPRVKTLRKGAKQRVESYTGWRNRKRWQGQRKRATSQSLETWKGFFTTLITVRCLRLVVYQGTLSVEGNSEREE